MPKVRREACERTVDWLEEPQEGPRDDDVEQCRGVQGRDAEREQPGGAADVGSCPAGVPVRHQPLDHTDVAECAEGGHEQESDAGH
jgi:hypothetical protein